MIKCFCDVCEVVIPTRDTVFSVKAVSEEPGKSPMMSWKYDEICAGCSAALEVAIEKRRLHHE